MSHSAAPARATKFRLTSPEPSEDDLQETVADALRVLLLPPTMWTAFPAGHVKLAPAQAARLYRMGLCRGWPDILIIHDGCVFGIELKTRTGVLSKTRIVRTRSGGARVVVGQRDMHTRLLASGMRLAVCRSLDGVLSQINAWGIPTREAKE